MAQTILPIFKTRPDGGRGDIINIGSIAGREPYQRGMFIKIDSGQVETELSIVRFDGNKAKADAVYN
ncbi:hypothetical protein BDV27DRAFT_160361 [Aspergillus caelatus]|uniref:Uncharacterized protein n=1 Tax=Aspergillus caelatus TaxID=61420 RepID=A0A5N6ZW13_9EURO|nr:uncharacterized protein BDV27DRAFT_160361 [Aspergillus caelatus]KAE8361801.1 hypothetical protein BDV27DRAFT_160361 [Aspergillus caelatus]